MAILFLAPRNVQRDAYFGDLKALAAKHIDEYTAVPIDVVGVGEDAAEEAFDLTNNPYRQEERELKYGRGRSLSVGDIVQSNGEKFLCMSCGWEKM